MQYKLLEMVLYSKIRKYVNGRSMHKTPCCRWRGLYPRLRNVQVIVDFTINTTTRGKNIRKIML